MPQPRVGGQVDTIRLELRGWKALEQMEVGWMILRHDRGELDQNLRQPDVVPVGPDSVHRGGGHDLGCGPSGAKSIQMLTKLNQVWRNPSENGVGLVRGRQVVGEAGDDDDVGVGTNGAQNVRQEIETRA